MVAILAIFFVASARLQHVQPKALAATGTTPDLLATGLACRLVIEEHLQAQALSLSS
jgi:hypothetical protein